MKQQDALKALLILASIIEDDWTEDNDKELDNIKGSLPFKVGGSFMEMALNDEFNFNALESDDIGFMRMAIGLVETELDWSDKHDQLLDRLCKKVNLTFEDVNPSETIKTPDDFDVKKGEQIEMGNGSQGHDLESTFILTALKDFNLKQEIDLILNEKPKTDMWRIEHKLVDKGFLRHDEKETKTFFLGYGKEIESTKELELYDR